MASEKTGRNSAPRCATNQAHGFVHPNPQPTLVMEMLILAVPPVAAIGWSLLYMLFGGGILGAIVIFIIAKMFRR